MGGGRYIGRVGGLAVALGIGIALAATPGIAWADESGSTSARTTEKAGPSSASEPTDSAKADNTRHASSDEDSDKSDSSQTTDSEASKAADVKSDGEDLAGSGSPEGGDQTTNSRRSARHEANGTNALDSAPPVNEAASRMTKLTLLAPSAPSPSNTGHPQVPVDSPVETALAAWGSRQRPGDAGVSSRSVESGQTFATALAVPNAAPDIPPQPVGIPHPVTGVVTGTVVVTNPGSSLTYALAGEAKDGSVVVNSQTGAYTYTPNQAARLAAGATPEADLDSFTISVGDGQQSGVATVQVYISPARLDTRAPIAVGRRPSALVVTSDGRMFVANSGSSTVSVINTSTGARIDANRSIFSKDISVGSAPGALALSADGKRLYVANAGSGSVAVIDTATYRRIDANPSIFSTRIAVGSSPTALLLSSTRLYVANRGSNTISVIDTATNKLVDGKPNIAGIQAISTGSMPSALALVGTKMYVANRSSNTLSVIDTTTNSVIKTISVGSQPSGLGVGLNNRLYVVNAGSGTVSVINTDTDAPVPFDPNSSGANPIPVGMSPSSVAVSPVGHLAYVTNGNDSVSVIDTESFTVIRTVAIDSDASGAHTVALSPNGTVYIADAADNNVRVLAFTPGSTTPPNATNTTVIGNVTLPGTQTGAPVLSPDGSRAVIVTGPGPFAHPGTTRVAVIDTATGGQVGTTVALPGRLAPNGTQVTADGQRAVITSSDSATTRLTVIDLATGTQVSSTPSDASPSTTTSVDPAGTSTLTYTVVGTASTGFTTQVKILDVATGEQIGHTFELRGDGSVYAPMWSRDGDRALITTRDWSADSDVITIRMAVMNTSTGDQVGETFVPIGEPSPMLSGDRTRALAFDTVSDPTSGVATHITAIDLKSGTHTTTTLDGAWRVPLTGADYGPELLNADGSHALVVSDVPDPNNMGRPTTLVAVVNTVTGTQVGNTLTVLGSEFGSRLVSLDSSRALIVTNTFDGRTGINTTRLSLIDTANATQVGTTSTIAGFMDGISISYSSDTNRAVVLTLSTNTATTGIPTVQVSVIDTVNGSQVGAHLTLESNYGTVELSADGTRALVSTSTQLAVINTMAGTLAGSTLSGPWGIDNTLSSDGRRAVIATVSYNDVTGTTSTKFSVLQIG